MKKILLLSTLVLSSVVFAETYNSVINNAKYEVKEAGAIHIVERGQTSTGGYTVWSDGYHEEWGLANDNDTVVFSKSFTNVNSISIQLTRANEGKSTLSAVPQIQELTTNSFMPYLNGGSGPDNVYWNAKGF